MSDKLLTPAELATVLQVTERWVFEHVKALPHYKFGKFVRFDLAEVKEHTRVAASIPTKPVLPEIPKRRNGRLRQFDDLRRR